jgi:phenylacetate-CoA ligase
VREPCPCGETTIRGFWGGRFKDLIAVQGVRFQVSEVESALRKVEAVTQPSLEFVVVKPAEQDTRLVVRVELGDHEDRAGVVSECAAAVKARIGVEAEVELLPRDSLPRSGYKAARVVDR